MRFRRITLRVLVAVVVASAHAAYAEEPIHMVSTQEVIVTSPSPNAPTSALCISIESLDPDVLSEETQQQWRAVNVPQVLLSEDEQRRREFERVRTAIRISTSPEAVASLVMTDQVVFLFDEAGHVVLKSLLKDGGGKVSVIEDEVTGEYAVTAVSGPEVPLSEILAEWMERRRVGDSTAVPDQISEAQKEQRIFWEVNGLRDYGDEHTGEDESRRLVADLWSNLSPDTRDRFEGALALIAALNDAGLDDIEALRVPPAISAPIPLEALQVEAIGRGSIRGGRSEGFGSRKVSLSAPSSELLGDYGLDTEDLLFVDPSRSFPDLVADIY